MAFVGGVLINLIRVLAAVVVGIVLWVAAIQAGIVRNPLDPVIRGDIEFARGDLPGMRVLFVGNSFTFHNSLPKMVRRLSEADRATKPIFAVQYAASNWKLRSAADDDGLDRLLSEVDWDVLVLQEHSLKLSFSAEYRREQTDSHARAILARSGGARPLLFMTWGYRGGDDGNVPHDTYLWMQQRVAWNYYDLGKELGAAVAPVGTAWAVARERRPEVELWHRDGQHPSKRAPTLVPASSTRSSPDAIPPGTASPRASTVTKPGSSSTSRATWCSGGTSRAGRIDRVSRPTPFLP